MYRISVLALAAGIICVSVAGGTARADLPDDQTIFFHIREDPEDPESSIVFTVGFELTADDIDGNSVGWEIQTIEFHQPLGAKLYSVWSEDLPYVPGDGLWWVDHSDPQDPVRSEFVLPPAMSGTADASEPEVDDLDYELEGETYTPPPGGPPFSVTASLTYYFAMHEDPEDPEEEGEDEPAEVPDGVNDPSRWFQ